MLLGVVMLFASCDLEFEAVRPAKLALFLDPSEANRAAVTKKFVAEALPKLQDCELVTRMGPSPGQNGGMCFKRAIETLWPDADQDLLAAGLKAQTAFYLTCVEKLGIKENPGPKRKIADLEPRLLEIGTASALAKNLVSRRENELPKGKSAGAAKRREEFLSRARETCVDPSSNLTCPGFPGLMQAFDPLLDQALPRLPAETQAWFQLRKKYPDRLQFLAAVLDRPTQVRGAVDAFVVWGMDQIFLGEPDPRLWDSDELAVLVSKARKKPDGLASLTFHLLGKRIGYQRANELIRNAPFSEDTVGYLGSSRLMTFNGPGGNYRHFETEYMAYLSEWRARPLDPGKAGLPEVPTHWNPPLQPGGPSVPEPVQTRGGETLEAYEVRRWHETDKNAPHPEMDRVLSLVRKWETEGGP